MRKNDLLFHVVHLDDIGHYVIIASEGVRHAKKKRKRDLQKQMIRIYEGFECFGNEKGGKVIV